MIRTLVALAAVMFAATGPAVAQVRQGKVNAVATAARAVAVNKVRPGLGNDPGRPVTLPLKLPGGVRIDGPIVGADADGGECKGKRLTLGSGRGVKACMAFCGSGEVELSDGLMLVSDSGEGQNGILVERVFFTLPPTLCTGGPKEDEDEDERKRKHFIVELNLQCANESKSPSFDKMRYSLAGITADPDLRELLGILALKKIETEEHHRIVGDAVYSITERKGLTAEDRAALASLPNRTRKA